jgi:hypothetical protein
MSRITSISQSITKTSSQDVSPTFLAKTTAKFKAEKQAKKIIASLDEVKRVQQGKKTPKSFDEFLNEL